MKSHAYLYHLLANALSDLPSLGLERASLLSSDVITRYLRDKRLCPEQPDSATSSYTVGPPRTIPPVCCCCICLSIWLNLFLPWSGFTCALHSSHVIWLFSLERSEWSALWEPLYVWCLGVLKSRSDSHSPPPPPPIAQSLFESSFDSDRFFCLRSFLFSFSLSLFVWFPLKLLNWVHLPLHAHECKVFPWSTNCPFNFILNRRLP